MKRAILFLFILTTFSLPIFAGDNDAKTRDLDVPLAVPFEPKPPSTQFLQQINEKVMAHFNKITLSDLIIYLAPEGWEVRFDVEDKRLTQHVVFHAETTRRRALDDILSKLGLKGVFYPTSDILLIYDRGKQ